MIKKIILSAILIYQKLPLPASCRFYPSCSQYTYEAVERCGTIKGLFWGLKRIIRCHPWGGKGYDPLLK